MTAPSTGRKLPSLYLPGGDSFEDPIKRRDLPPVELFRDDIEDIVAKFTEAGAERFNYSALDAGWDDIQTVIDRAGGRTLHEMSLQAEPEFVTYWVEVNLDRKGASIGYAHDPKSTDDARWIAARLMQRRRRGPALFWRFVGQYSTIHLDETWGEHRGLLAKNRDLIVGAVGAVIGAVALFVLQRLGAGA